MGVVVPVEEAVVGEEEVEVEVAVAAVDSSALRVRPQLL
jgi:hypothetical protein